jgi:hypothetical protein
MLRAVLAAGVQQERITGVKVTSDGYTILLNQAPITNGSAANDLDAELEQFEARHGQG